MRHEVQKLAIKPVHKAELGLAQFRCAVGNHVEHRLGVRHRAGNDAEHLGRRGLLLERLAQIIGARLHLVEQAHILDGDDGLVGESRDQLNLFLREWPDLGSHHHKIRQLGLALAQEGTPSIVR